MLFFWSFFMQRVALFGRSSTLSSLGFMGYFLHFAPCDHADSLTDVFQNRSSSWIVTACISAARRFRHLSPCD